MALLPQDYRVVGTSEDLERYNTVLRRRWQERPEAVAELGPAHRRLLLLGQPFSVMIDQRGTQRGLPELAVTVLHRYKPRCFARPVEDQLWMHDYGRGRSLNWVLRLVQSLVVGPPELVPFGLVHDKQVQALVWAGPVRIRRDSDDQIVASLEAYAFGLGDGREAWLRSDPAVVWPKLGSAARLGARLRAQPVRLVTEGDGRRYLVLDGTDEAKPRLGRRYRQLPWGGQLATPEIPGQNYFRP